MYLTIGRGRGYSAAEEEQDEEAPIGLIPIDSIFLADPPHSYSVDSACVGQRPTSTSSLSSSRPTAQSSPGGAARGFGILSQEPGDLHRTPSGSRS